MSNLHIFGDSFSVSWEDGIERDVRWNPDKSKTKRNVYQEYKDYLGRLPVHFADVIKDHFKFNKVFNYSIGGASNDTILQTIGSNIDKIHKDDYVIVGWSDLIRYRVLHRDITHWVHILPNSKTRIKEESFKRSCIEELVHRDIKYNYLIKNHISMRNLVTKALPCKHLFWTPFTQKNKQIDFYPGFLSRIVTETDGKVDDAHYGEEGMKQLGKILIDKIKYNNLI